MESREIVRTAPYAAVSFVKRPNAGRAGRPIRVGTNFFSITNLPKDNIIQYDVTITPDVPPAINHQVLRQFEEVNKSRLQGKKLVYDGRKIAYSAQRMPFGDAVKADIILPERAGGRRSKEPRKFNIKIRKVANINMHELNEFLNGKCRISPNIMSGIMALDIMFRHHPFNTFVSVGRSFFIDPQDSAPLPGGLIARQGFYQSVRPTNGQLILNVDTSATAFYGHGPMIDLACRILNCRHPGELPRSISGRDYDKLDTFIKGVKFVVTHRQNRPQYRASKLTKTDAQKTTFTHGDGSRQSVAEYFAKQYNMRLRFPNLPCIEVKKDMYFPLEVCEVLPDQRYGRKLTPEQTDGMIRFTTYKPHDRLNKIRKGVQLLEHAKDPYLQQFGVRVDTRNTIVADARVLQTPRLQYHPQSGEPSVTPRDGNWNMRDKRVFSGATLKSWAVLVLAERLRQPDVERFITELANVCHRTGMNVVTRRPIIDFGNAQGNIEERMQQLAAQARNKFRDPIQMIVCILPDTGVARYAEIKRVGETVIGIPTQCIVAKHVGRPNVQYCANVCLKMNAKLGGINVVLAQNQLPFIAEKPTIIIGADVSHPAPGDTRRPSIATLVGSLDANVSRFCSVVRFQQGRSESINDLRDMVADALKCFYRNSGHKPARILFYRDGISEGEFERVNTTEVKAVKLACQKLEPNYNPALTYIAVQKRHHTRLFPMGRDQSDRSGNCLPGTVVDTHITSPYEFDFFLQSHAGIQGTSRPAHYQVLYDENRFNADTLQELTYRLCYLYARCTRSVGVVPPIYYADLLALRVRYHAQGDSFSEEVSLQSGGSAPSYAKLHTNLQNCMFYM
jgi:hypothetical protein